MPHKVWGLLFPAITLIFYFFEELILFDGGHFGTRGERFVGIIGIYALIIGAVYWLTRRAGKGTVTAAGLVRGNGPAIPLACVERIVSASGGFPAVVFANGNQVKMHLADREIVKLARTRLNQWRIKGRELSLSPLRRGRN
jgi:hypothetical protein